MSTFADLETVYERLAAAIDAAGPDKAEIFLAKVVLLLAARTGDADGVLKAIADGLADL